MTETTIAQFRQVNAFFKTLHFERGPSIPDQLSIDVTAQLRVHTDKLPQRLQIDVKVESATTDPLALKVELIGLYDLLEGQEEPTPEMVEAYINERALFMMFPLIQDILRKSSVSMGFRPIETRMPYRFDFRFDDAPQEEEE